MLDIKMDFQEISEAAHAKLIKNIKLVCDKFEHEKNKRFEPFLRIVETGDISYFKNELEKLGILGESKNDSKENIEPADSTYQSLPKRTTRQKNASSVSQITIKKEKMSLALNKDATMNFNLTYVADTDHNNQSDLMLAPTALPPRRKKIKQEVTEPVKRSTRSRTKPKKVLETSIAQSDKGKSSDVIVQDTRVTTVDITNYRESVKENSNDKASELTTEARCTRTKTRQKKKQEEKENVENSSNVAEACENVQATNSTHIEPGINLTMVVEKPKILRSEEGKEEIQDTEVRPKTPHQVKSKKMQIKEIFSPFEKTTLKTKIEAFEKIGSASKQKFPNDESKNDSGIKAYTPFLNKFAPKNCSTSKIRKNFEASTNKSSLNNDSVLSMKSLSALKASQAEFREREKKRKEKEREVQLKKEALLQARSEEKRKRREEKILKVQLQKEMIQKERERHLELQKMKDEKHKQAVAEKEEKLQKSKEEAERKRLLVKYKAQQLAKENGHREENKDGKMKRPHQQHTIPIYMLSKAPPLQTEDCFDSDDEEYRKVPYNKPFWAKDNNLKKQLNAQLVAKEKIKNTLFCSQSHSPDLTEIFENIDPKKLKRTSSAIWRKPPRYTLFSTTSDILFSEDSDEDIA